MDLVVVAPLHDVLITLTHQSGPVSNGSAQEATVNEIEGLMVGPFGLYIINLETDI